MKETSYSREQAAEILGISTRTLDRYLKSKKIKSSQIQGRVRLYQTELEKFGEFLGKTIVTSENFITKEEPQTSKEIAIPQGQTEVLYKNLYEEVKQELRDAYKDLQITNYKLGKLEEQLKNSVPLLEQRNKEEEIKSLETNFENKSQDIEQKLKIERINKWIFVVLLFGILALQPILWILSK